MSRTPATWFVRKYPSILRTRAANKSVSLSLRNQVDAGQLIGPGTDRETDLLVVLRPGGNKC